MKYYRVRTDAVNRRQHPREYFNGTKIEDAVEKVQAFKRDYNGFRPQSALSGLTPNEAI